MDTHCVCENPFKSIFDWGVPNFRIEIILLIAICSINFCILSASAERIPDHFYWNSSSRFSLCLPINFIFVNMSYLTNKALLD